MSAGRAGRGAARGAALATVALCLLALGASPATSGEVGASGASAPLRLRYGWSPGQTWRATQSVERETRLGDDVQRERGIARFEYRVLADESGDGVRLEARMLSQETAAGVSPLEFSAILFRAGVDAQGRKRGAHYSVEVLAPAAAEDVEPLARRRALRQVASAWRDAVFWFPELPERTLAPGEAFVVKQEGDLDDAEPGLAMRVDTTRSYRLLSVERGVARFRVEERSKVDAATADSAIASQQRAEGEARFDLALGMWTHHELVSAQRARYSGAPEGGLSGEATSRSVTSIEMQRAAPDAGR